MSIFKLFASTSQTPTQAITTPSIWRGLFGNTSKAGIKVDNLTAMQHTTVMSCWRVLSESLASMPLHLMHRELKDGQWYKRKAYEHPLYNLLNRKPYKEITSYNFIEALMLNIVSRGNAFAQILRNNAGDIAGLIPLLSDNMQIVRNTNTNELAYIYTHDSFGDVWLDKSEVIHITGLSFDGIHGLSPISYSANAIGLGIAIEEFGSNFFKNGANASGMFETDRELSDEAYNRLRSQLREKYEGLKNSGKPMLLEEGLKFNKITVSNNDSQFLESRKYQRSEIASIFRVPLHLINDLERATFSNIEQQSLEFVTYTMTPWVRRFEDAFNAALFGDSNEYYVHFNMDSLIRGDISSRYEANGKAIRDGWKTRNEVRIQEGLNPIDGLNEPILPLNMQEKGADEDQKKNKAANNPKN